MSKGKYPSPVNLLQLLDELRPQLIKSTRDLKNHNDTLEMHLTDSERRYLAYRQGRDKK